MMTMLNHCRDQKVQTDPGLVADVREFVQRALAADGKLREFMVSTGMTPTDRSLAYAWHDTDVDQRGEMPGGNFAFHGLGCSIKLGGDTAVDIDWSADCSIVLGPGKVRNWLSQSGRGEVERDAVALSTLVEAGDVQASPDNGEFVVNPHSG